MSNTKRLYLTDLQAKIIFDALREYERTGNQVLTNWPIRISEQGIDDIELLTLMELNMIEINTIKRTIKNLFNDNGKTNC